MKPGWVVLVLGISLLPLAAAVSPHFALSHDAATYAVLAENLAAGQGYTYQGYAHVKYPPGFPLLLAGVSTLWGRDLLAWRLTTALLGALSLICAWRLAAAREGERTGLALALAMGGTGFLVSHTTYTLTDVPFLGLVCLACLGGRRFLARPSLGRGLALGGLIALAASCRLVGLLLLPALVAAWFSAPARKDRWRLTPLLPTAALVLLSLALWLLYKSQVGPLLPEDLRDGATYMGEMRGGLWLDAPQGFWATILHQARIRPIILCGTCARLLSGDQLGWPGGGPWAGQTGWFAMLSLLLVLAATLRTWWLRRGILDWFFLFYLALLMVTPAFVGTRYFIPILPLLLGSLFTGLGDLARRAGGPRAAGIALPTALLLYLALWLPNLTEVITSQHRPGYYPEAQAPFVQAARSLAKDPPGTTVCNEAALVHFLSRTRTTGFPLTTEEEVKAWIRERADRVLLTSWGYPVHETLLRQATAGLLQQDHLQQHHLWGDPASSYALILLPR